MLLSGVLNLTRKAPLSYPTVCGIRSYVSYSGFCSSFASTLRSRFTTNQRWLKITPKKNCFQNTRNFHSVFRSSLLYAERHALGFGITTGIIGSLSLVLYAKDKYIAQCRLPKTSHKSRILDEHEKKVIKKEPHFDWKAFLKILWPDAWLFILAAISAFAVAMVNVQLPVLLGELVNSLSSLSNAADDVHNHDVFLLLYKPCLKLLINYISQAGLTIVYISLLSAFGERMSSRMRQTLFTSLLEQDVAFFDEHKTGELVSRLSADVQDLKSSFKQCISQGLKSSTQAVGSVITLYNISPQLTSIMLILVPGIILIGSCLGSMLRKLSRTAQEHVAIATAVADEALGNIRTVKAFAMEKQEMSWYKEKVDRACRLNEYLGFGIGVFQGVSNFAINGMVLLVLYAGGTLLDARQITPGELMSFLIATQNIQRSLASMSVLFGQVVRGMSAGARVFEYIHIIPKIPSHGGKIITNDQFYGNIEFNNVSFAYPTRKNDVVLENFSIKVQRGTMVALCGPSGSGKSTIAALIERFYDVDSGMITIDGVPIKELDVSWLRGHAVGFINQEPLLFATTIMENIRYGDPSATNEQVYAAAALANADDFIKSFPEGYNTIVGERGITVSGGQRQRIAIARALLKNPKIIILDEATSALDAESESIVQDALDHAAVGRTVVVIAHRLSTIRNADTIAVLGKSNILEAGTHTELMQKNGVYADLVRKQTIEEED